VWTDRKDDGCGGTRDDLVFGEMQVDGSKPKTCRGKITGDRDVNFRLEWNPAAHANSLRRQSELLYLELVTMYWAHTWPRWLGSCSVLHR